MSSHFLVDNEDYWDIMLHIVPQSAQKVQYLYLYGLSSAYKGGNWLPIRSLSLKSCDIGRLYWSQASILSYLSG